MQRTLCGVLLNVSHVAIEACSGAFPSDTGGWPRTFFIYRDEFRKRGIDARRIEHPFKLGTSTLRAKTCASMALNFSHGLCGFTAFETTGTTSAIPKRIFFSLYANSTRWADLSNWSLSFGRAC